MNAMRQLYDMLMAGTMRHARWEYETSMNILRSKKRMLLVAVLTIIPMVIYGMCFAGDDTLPRMLGEKTAYSPAFYELKIFLVTIAIGLCAGLITGCIGAGGGFIITPALMSAGIKGILAVGTDLFHIFAKAIMGTVVHKKLGNVNVPLAVAFLVGSILGVLVGG
ncbi:MAG: sulfite exporter TauE/SafE family protein, partial [Desulfovibrio sp.]|nr:sulfite exporter TauE/SafE family protein [Desulfovibrio sp.]